MFLLLHCLCSEGEIQGFVLYRQERQYYENTTAGESSRGKQQWFYQLALLVFWGFWQGFAGPRYSPGLDYK